MYGTAYSEAARVPPSPPSPLQRHFETAAVAELLHVKARAARAPPPSGSTPAA